MTKIKIRVTLVEMAVKWVSHAVDVDASRRRVIIDAVAVSPRRCKEEIFEYVAAQTPLHRLVIRIANWSPLRDIAELIRMINTSLVYVRQGRSRLSLSIRSWNVNRGIAEIHIPQMRPLRPDICALQ